MEMLFKLLHQLRGKRAEIIFGKSCYKKISGDNVINLSVLCFQRTIQFTANEFTLGIYDQSNFIIERIGCFDVTADRFLQIFKFTADLYHLRIHSRLNQKNIHHFFPFICNFPFFTSLKIYAGEILGIQNNLRIIIGLSHFLFGISSGFCFYRDCLFQSLCNVNIKFFQISILHSYVDMKKATIYKPYSS